MTVQKIPLRTTQKILPLFRSEDADAKDTPDTSEDTDEDDGDDED